MAPIVPGVTDTDESLERTVRAIADSGAVSVSPIVLHLRPGAREWFLRWLTASRPDLLPRYRELYRGGSYALSSYQTAITARVTELAARYGIDQRSPRRSRGASLERQRARDTASADDSRREEVDQLTLL
jgi:DNA repair photolyase